MHFSLVKQQKLFPKMFSNDYQSYFGEISSFGPTEHNDISNSKWVSTSGTRNTWNMKIQALSILFFWEITGFPVLIGQLNALRCFLGSKISILTMRMINGKKLLEN